MAKASLVHVCNCAYNFNEEVMGHRWRVPSKLFHVVVHLTSFNALNCHGVIYLKLTDLPRLLDLNNSLRNDLDQLDDIRVALDALKNMGVIHEDDLLLNILLALKVWPLYDLECRVLNVFILFLFFFLFNLCVYLLHVFQSWLLLDDLRQLRHDFLILIWLLILWMR